MDLGTRIHKLRVRQRLTLQQVAEACGVSRSLLSKIETGKARPAVATLTRIARALGVPTAALLEDSKVQSIVLNTAESIDDRPWTKTDKGYAFRALCAERIDKAMQPVLFVARKGQMKPGLLRHSGEEFIYILKGRMRYRVGRVIHELGPGDCLYFDAEDAHDLQPLTATVTYLAVLADRSDAPSKGAVRRGPRARATTGRKRT